MKEKTKKHETARPHRRARVRMRHAVHFLLGSSAGIILLCLILGYIFLNRYEDRAFPGVFVGNFDASGKTFEEITAVWNERNHTFSDVEITLEAEKNVATISAASLDIGFDATLSATQALNVGRSNSTASNLYQLYQAATTGIHLTPYFRWEQEPFTQVLDSLSEQILVEPENPLFEFHNGRVTAFKQGKNGKYLDRAQTLTQFVTLLESFAKNPPTEKNLTLKLAVLPKEPTIKDDGAQEYGISQLIGTGESFYRGSIAGRVYNLTLAASRINGVLVPPDGVFSFNTSVGDISAATGYKQAYVIKNGRTVLDDGGGVCQVSTTLFRAALNAGLPITERHAHSYRVGYYEQGGWKPGFDATVYAPSYDLKIKNDTGHHLLIQAKAEPALSKLTFELYGTTDGREAHVSPVRLWEPKPAPPDLYQDDPTLPTGQVKQVDWANPGIKATFDYTVNKNGEELFKQSYFSNYVPWQAVYLRGTGV